LSAFNYSNLSSYDFEVLCRDLLNEEHRLNLRSFAPGADGGVDLKGWHSGGRNRRVVVQCKHYMGSSWSQLRTSVEKEVVKLGKLKPEPTRYILATSRALTEANIATLKNILGPFCKSLDDIVDQARLDQMLQRHDIVLRNHHKLWLSSTQILGSILQAPLLNRSEDYRNRLIRNSRTFVQPHSFSVAREVLSNEHSCVISGPPGVGKTTLAEMLALEYLAAKYELFVVGEDIREAEGAFREPSKQLFLYDDFLGRTDVTEKLGKNEDGRLVAFMDRVRDSPSHRFILTTREYILRSAQLRYEKLDRGNIEILKCVLEMSDYSRFERGLILYQHLYFDESLSRDEVGDLVASKGYRDIIDHRNYTPRHVTDALFDIKQRRRKGDL